MKSFIRLLLLMLPLVSAAQSSLPPCPATGFKHNCFGSAVPGSAEYKGEFQSNVPNGRGVWAAPDSQGGSKYVGEFKDGKLNGQGVYTMPGDSKYVGEFKNESKQGGIDAWFYSGIRFVCCHDGVLLALTDLGVFL